VHGMQHCVLKTDSAGVIAIQPSGTHRLSPQNLSMLGQAAALVSADVVKHPEPQTFFSGVRTFDCSSDFSARAAWASRFVSHMVRMAAALQMRAMVDT